jgi:CheY-like chemotaxis protein
MLAFARRQELKQESVDVPELVRGMTELLQRSLGSAVGIETRFPLALKPVRADANQLEMAVLNLSVNARDAMPDGGQIVIAAREQTVAPDNGSTLKPGQYVCFSVTDTGVGMDDATLQRAAEPFFTTKGPGKGTGLGLSMVHGLAEQSGGRFVMRSRVGEGTTAELWLPVAEGIAKAADQHLPAPAESADRYAFAVLAVDDDALVLTNTVAMLDDLGHGGIAASSANEALDILRRGETVDVVITDQIMPQMTGLQLAEKIEQEWPGLPVILATGYAEITPGEGPDLPKLPKPFTQAELAEQLARIRPRERRGRVLRFRAGKSSNGAER